MADPNKGTTPDKLLQELLSQTTQLDPEANTPEPEKVVARPKYTAYDHQRAYEIWRDTHNLAEVARQMQVPLKTLRDWRRVGYGCKFGCPFHGWKELSQQEYVNLAGKLSINDKLTDSILEAYDKQELDPRMLTRSKEEVLVHLELMRAKAFHRATGIPLDVPFSEFFKDGERILDREALLEAFAKTTDFRSCSEAMKSYLALTDQINAMCEELGINKVTTLKETAKDQKLAKMDWQKAERVRKLLAKLDPEDRQLFSDTLMNGVNVSDLLEKYGDDGE